MHRPSCIRLRGCYFDEVLCQKLPVSIPQLIAFFGDYPSNIGCDLWQIGFPSVFVHLCHETANWNSSCPYKKCVDNDNGRNRADRRVMAYDLDSNVAVVREAVNETRSLSPWERAARQPQADAPGEGRRSRRILRPSSFLEASRYRACASRPLPEGEGDFSVTSPTGFVPRR